MPVMSAYPSPPSPSASEDNISVELSPQLDRPSIDHNENKYLEDSEIDSGSPAKSRSARRGRRGSAGDVLSRQRAGFDTSTTKCPASDTAAPESSKSDISELSPKERIRQSYIDHNVGHIPIQFAHARAKDLGAFNPYMVKSISSKKSELTDSDLKELEVLVGAATEHIPAKEDDKLLANLRVAVGLAGDSPSNTSNKTATKQSRSTNLKGNSLVDIINDLARLNTDQKYSKMVTAIRLYSAIVVHRFSLKNEVEVNAVDL